MKNQLRRVAKQKKEQQRQPEQRQKQPIEDYEPNTSITKSTTAAAAVRKPAVWTTTIPAATKVKVAVGVGVVVVVVVAAMGTYQTNHPLRI